MDYNSEPDFIQFHPPVIDEHDGGYSLYFHDLPPILLNNPIIFSKEDLANIDIWLPRPDDPGPVPIPDEEDEEDEEDEDGDDPPPSAQTT